jgi:NADH-quinone oxidoreductase subunit M
VHEHPWLALSLILATALNGMTVVRAYFAMFTGGRRGTGSSDLGPREWVTVTFLLLLLMGAGFRPSVPIRALRGGSTAASPH